MDSPIKLIAGLGNPGPAYECSRHNAGAELVAALAGTQHAALKVDSKFFGSTVRITLGGCDVRLLVPSTYMNHSGRAVAAIASYYQLEPNEILIVHDELDLLPGTVRFKKGGGHGGHNGLRDTIQCLGNSREFARLRIGIGHPGHANMVTDFVLKNPPMQERERIIESIDRALRWLPLAIIGDWEKAMTGLHSDKKASQVSNVNSETKQQP